MTRLDYRADIDGLRAVAVLCVVIFHVWPQWLPGGFIGVDVFFVISGFLITRLIRDELAAGTFSFTRFYLRRARRLFPALLVTLALTFVVGSFVLAPSHLERFSGALLSSLVWISNFYFYGESGYFDADKYFKPLLHTWSLSVEEQFYLVWPTLLVLLAARGRGRTLPLVIGVLGVLSLAVSQWGLRLEPTAVFFLAPFRVCEFALGALLVWSVQKQSPQALAEAAMLVGLGLILMAALQFTEASDFPGLRAMLPCVGAALVIQFGAHSKAAWLLRNPIALFFGLISYSLYLVHWPVVVYYRYLDSSFGTLDRLLVVIISVVAASLLYRFVETPLRRPVGERWLASNAAFIAVSVACALVLAVPSASAWTSNGWPWRWDLPPTFLHMAANHKAERTATSEFAKSKRDLSRVPFAPRVPGRHRVLIIGDSHAKDMYNALALNDEYFGHLDLRILRLRSECMYLYTDTHIGAPEKVSDRVGCERQVERFADAKLPRTADWILYSARWQPASLPGLDEFVDYLAELTDAKLAIFGRTAEFDDVPKLALHYGKVEGINEFLATRRTVKLDAINANLAKLATEHELVFIDKLSIVCDLDEARCDAIDADANVLFYDYGHWSLKGASHFGRKMGERDVLAFMD